MSNNELLSLSLTDKVFNVKNSINTTDILNLIVQNGGYDNYSINFIIGLVLIGIGFIMYMIQCGMISVCALIKDISCIDDKYKIIVSYEVNNEILTGTLYVPVTYNPSEDNTINIIYDSNNISDIKLDDINYQVISGIVIAIGFIFLLISWMNVPTNIISTDTTNSPYSKTQTSESQSGLYVVED